MNIREYMDYLMKANPMVQKTDYDWRQAFNKIGYPSVLLGFEGLRQWEEVHDWCREEIGEHHYAWTGSRFWFDRREDAALFALRWS